MILIRTTLLASLLILAAACSDRNRVARASEDVEARAPVVVHPHIDNRIRYVKHSVHRTEDGRLAFKVVIASRSDRDLAVIVTTDFFDENGMPVERSTPHQILIPSGGTKIIEDVSFSPKAARFTVQIRPASTKRA